MKKLGLIVVLQLIFTLFFYIILDEKLKTIENANILAFFANLLSSIELELIDLKRKL